jgi:hypothetical protein
MIVVLAHDATDNNVIPAPTRAAFENRRWITCWRIMKGAVGIGQTAAP